MASRRVAVAFSGGRDSTALLHATVAVASPLGLDVLALHVHHGLSPNADAWLSHCGAQCRRWARAGKPVSFMSRRLAGHPPKGDSVEAWARQARYGALREMALSGGAPIVLLAHHRRDQAETFLLQALRGAGVAGMSAMPRRVVRDGVEWHRPWLEQGDADIEAYVHRHRLGFIEDESNADPRFDRNRLRLNVWPLLAEAFPHADSAFATSAEWAQQATIILHEVAAADLEVVSSSDGLLLAEWHALLPARRSNVLRAWLTRECGEPPSSNFVRRLLDEVDVTGEARWSSGWFALRQYRGVLRCEPNLDARDSTALVLPPESTLSVRRAGTYALPGWRGSLKAERVHDTGVPLDMLVQLDLRDRRGGETFQADLCRPARSLKKQYQDAGIPAWFRSGPLLYSGDRLVFVPGLGLDVRCVASAGEHLFALTWLPASDEAEKARPRR